MKYKPYKILNIVKCSRNFEFQKQTDQNFFTQNLFQEKVYCISKKKELLKECQKEFMWIYEYILAFAGWRSIFRVVVDVGRYILGGGGWWWVMVDGGGSWWVMVDGIWDKMFKNGPNKICASQTSKIWKDMGCFNRPHKCKFFEGCLLEILRSPFLDTLSHLWNISGLQL